MHYDAVIGPSDLLPGKGFTDPGHTEREVGLMRSMLRLERERARTWVADEGRTAAGRVVRDVDRSGNRHLLVVPDLAALDAARDVTAVGFFARTRKRIDHAILFELEEKLVAGMHSYAEMGLLSYYDIGLGHGTYGNLILFATADVPPEWHADALHRRAVELSPEHYFEVRLHKGSIPGRFVGSGDIVIERTKYFDFKRGSRWRALRQFAA